jgi:hypothetical protein
MLTVGELVKMMSCDWRLGLQVQKGRVKEKGKSSIREA